MKQEEFDFQVIIHSGKNNEPAATLGLATALSVISTGAKVVIFFTLEGAKWADPNEGKVQTVPNFDSIDTYMNMLHELGAVFEGCTACIEAHCSHLKCSEKEFSLRPGFRLAGLSTAAIRAMNVKTLPF